MSAFLREHGHADRLYKKKQRVDGLKDLLKTHEESDNPDWIEIAQLMGRLKRAEKQLEHMRP